MVLHAKGLALCGSDIKVCLTKDKFLYFIVAINIVNGNLGVLFCMLLYLVCKAFAQFSCIEVASLVFN